MSSSMTTMRVGRYQFTAPSAWSFARLDLPAPMHAVQTAPRNKSTMQIEVLDGVGTPEMFEHYVAIRRSGGEARALSDAVPLPATCHGAWLVRVCSSGETVCKRVEACLFESDILATVLSWIEVSEAMSAIEREARLLLSSALKAHAGERAGERADPSRTKGERT